MFGVQQAMVAKMVVDVGDQDREHKPPPELLDVYAGSGPVLPQGIDDLRVKVHLLVVRIGTDERGGRDEGNPLAR